MRSLEVDNYYLHGISRPNIYGVPQVDLSKDREAVTNLPDGLSLSSNQMAVERVICKMFTHYHCDVIINDRIRSFFTVKLWRMGKQFQSSGGRVREKILEKWKKTKWVVNLNEDEIVPRRKRKPDDVIVQSGRLKITKLEQEVKETNKKLKDISNQCKALEKSCKTLSIALKAKKGRSYKPRQKKAWDESSRQYQRKRERQIAKDVQMALSFTQDENFRPINIELKNKESGKILWVDQDGQVKEKRESLDSSSNAIDQTLHVKEKFNISNQAYHEMSMVNSGLPRLRSLQNAAKSVDALSFIRPTPGELIGVQQSLNERLQWTVKSLVQNNPSFCSNRKLKVKLTGDGTYVSRSMHIIVFAFALIHDETNSSSPMGNHALALLNCGEEYEKLAESLKDLLNEIENLKSIQIDDIVYDLEYFLGADMKFLALCVGIESANAKFSCVWCKCAADERYDTKKEWSFQDTNKGAHTLDEIQKLSALHKSKKNEKFGCIRKPLFPMVPIDHVIPDILHLFLRISDVLTNLLITDLRKLDGIAKGIINSMDELSRGISQVLKYEKFLNEQCKISFHMYVDKDTKYLKWRDLTGPEKLKLFAKIDISKLFPNLPETQTIQKIWVNFFEIYNILRARSIDEEKIEELKQKSQDWLKLFLSVYQTKHVTPYMHTLVAHVPEFLNLYGSLSSFSQQGLEKLNDLLTNNYFRSTNHHSTDALRQLLIKFNRMEELQDSQRVKQEHRCRICHEIGHNA